MAGGLEGFDPKQHVLFVRGGEYELTSVRCPHTYHCATGYGEGGGGEKRDGERSGKTAKSKR